MRIRTPPSHGVRALCPTCWTVHGDALESILDHWQTLNLLWDDSLESESKLDRDVKALIIFVQAQMNIRLLFGVHLSKIILTCTDNLSWTLQKHAMSAAKGHSVAELTVAT